MVQLCARNTQWPTRERMVLTRCVGSQVRSVRDMEDPEELLVGSRIQALPGPTLSQSISQLKHILIPCVGSQLSPPQPASTAASTVHPFKALAGPADSTFSPGMSTVVLYISLHFSVPWRVSAFHWVWVGSRNWANLLRISAKELPSLKKLFLSCTIKPFLFGIISCCRLHDRRATVVYMHMFRLFSQLSRVVVG